MIKCYHHIDLFKFVPIDSAFSLITKNKLFMLPSKAKPSLLQQISYLLVSSRTLPQYLFTLSLKLSNFPSPMYLYQQHTIGPLFTISLLPFSLESIPVRLFPPHCTQFGHVKDTINSSDGEHDAIDQSHLLGALSSLGFTETTLSWLPPLLSLAASFQFPLLFFPLLLTLNIGELLLFLDIESHLQPIYAHCLVISSIHMVLKAIYIVMYLNPDLPSESQVLASNCQSTSPLASLQAFQI